MRIAQRMDISGRVKAGLENLDAIFRREEAREMCRGCWRSGGPVEDTGGAGDP
jgi:hypothetical protein